MRNIKNIIMYIKIRININSVIQNKLNDNNSYSHIIFKLHKTYFYGFSNYIV